MTTAALASPIFCENYSVKERREERGERSEERGARREEGGGRRREEGRREEGGGRREEGGGRREEGGGRREEGGGRREERGERRAAAVPNNIFYLFCPGLWAIFYLNRSGVQNRARFQIEDFHN